MTEFYYIAYQEIARHDEQVFKQFLQLEGCEFCLEREGIIVKPNSHAHIQAHLRDIKLLKGLWLEPEEV